MIASLVSPVHYDKLAGVKFYLCLGGLALALFVILAAACAIQGALAGRATQRRVRK